MKQDNKELIKEILSYSFQLILFLFLITLLLQQFYPFEVNTRISVNGFMLAVIILGALSILFPPSDMKIGANKKITWKGYFLIIGLGILGAVIIFLKLNSLGWIGYLISILGGLIIIFLSYLIFGKKDED